MDEVRETKMRTELLRARKSYNETETAIAGLKSTLKVVRPMMNKIIS